MADIYSLCIRAGHPRACCQHSGGVGKQNIPQSLSYFIIAVQTSYSSIELQKSAFFKTQNIVIEITCNDNSNDILSIINVFMLCILSQWKEQKYNENFLGCPLANF